MRILFTALLIQLFFPLRSYASWNPDTNYNVNSGNVYHNKALHLYGGKEANSLLLTGDSYLTLNGNSLLSNSIARNKSSIHMYISDKEISGNPVIRDTNLNGKSTITMETGSFSLGQLFIDKKARLEIRHADEDSTNTFFNVPKISGSVYIENLNLAGRACIAPISTLVGEYDDDIYQQQPGDMVITYIDRLTMQPGSLLSMQEYIHNMQFNQLEIKNLSGRGNFILSSHLAGGLSDKLAVSEQASGRFGLAIADSGYEPVTPQRVNLITINKGDAHFDLLNHNGIVEAGVWQYTLQHDQTGERSDWYLSNNQQSGLGDHSEPHLENQLNTAVNTPITENEDATNLSSRVNLAKHSKNTPALSHSAQAVMNMASASRHILTTELSTLRQRTGDVRHHNGTFSLWMHHLKDNSHFTSNHGTSFHTHLQGIQIGIDNRFQFNDGRWLLGTFMSDSNTTVWSEKIKNGSIRSLSGSLYATWLGFSDFYWDNVFKLNHFRHEIDTKMNNGQAAKGHYHQRGLSITSEIGNRFPLSQVLALTPYGKVNYLRTSKVKQILDNGLATTLPLASSLDGEAGLLLEIPFSLGEQRISPYLKAAISREFTGDNTLTINGTTLTLADTRTLGKYGLGSTLQVADNLSAWVEIDYQKGKKIETPVTANFGIRASF